MRKFHFLVLFSSLWILLICTGASKVYAQGKHGFGVGVIIGDKTGFSLKKWVNEHSGVDFAIGWSISEPSFLFSAF